MNVILSDVFFFYRQHFSRLIAYIIPVSMFISLVSLGIAELTAGDDPTQHLKVLVVSNFLFNPLYLGGLTYLLFNLSNNRSVSQGNCLIYGAYRWMPVLAVSIVYGMLTAVGLFLFIFPGIWIFSRFILAPFLVILDKASPLDALKESYEKTANDVWIIMGTTTLLFLGLLMIQHLVLSLLPGTSVLVTVITSIIGDILWSILTILWFRFYDLLKNGN